MRRGAGSTSRGGRALNMACVRGASASGSSVRSDFCRGEVWAPPLHGPECLGGLPSGGLLTVPAGMPAKAAPAYLRGDSQEPPRGAGGGPAGRSTARGASSARRGEAGVHGTPWGSPGGTPGTPGWCPSITARGSGTRPPRGWLGGTPQTPGWCLSLIARGSGTQPPGARLGAPRRRLAGVFQ